MIKTIFSQRVNYAIVEKYRNYSSVSDRPERMDRILEPKIFGDRYPTDVDIINLPPNEIRGKKLRQLFYFTSNKVEGERVRIKRSPLGGIFLTQDTEKISKSLSDPFSNVRIYTRENRIMQEGNTVKMVMDVYLKHKDFNNRYSRKRVNKLTVKFDFDKGNTIIMKQRGKSKEFRTNSFWFLDDIELDYFRDIFPKSINSNNVPLSKKHKDIEILMNPKFMILTLTSVCKQFVDLSREIRIEQSYHDKKNNDTIRWTLKKIGLLNLIKGKNIKVCDNFENILINFYPTQKYLKRNKNKLIQSCLDRMDINHSPSIKIAHKNFNNTLLIRQLKSIIGDDYYRYISNINWQRIDEITNSNLEVLNNGRAIRFHAYGVEEVKPTLKSKREKSNLVKILNDYLTTIVSENELTQFLSDMVDHIRIMEKISDVNPGISLNARTRYTFIEEHRLYSKFERRMDRDSTVLLEYDENFIDLINEPFEIDGFLFRPILLIHEDQYIDEGEEMSHCVAGYIGNKNSIIISLTEVKSNERSTIEYDTFTGQLKQERSKFNKTPAECLLIGSKFLTRRINSIPSPMRSAVRKRIDRNGNYIDYIQNDKRGVMRFPIDF